MQFFHQHLTNNCKLKVSKSAIRKLHTLDSKAKKNLNVVPDSCIQNQKFKKLLLGTTTTTTKNGTETNITQSLHFMTHTKTQ